MQVNEKTSGFYRMVGLKWGRDDVRLLNVSYLRCVSIGRLALSPLSERRRIACHLSDVIPVYRDIYILMIVD